MIFDEATLRKLNQLTLVAGRVRAGVLKGERRSTKRGTSIEFADYRNYTRGDDLRRLDWNVYARLDRPFIKLLEEEEDLAVHILLDISRSMDWGEGELHKLTYGLRLSAALGAIALSSGDRLAVSLLQDGQVSSEFGPVRGQNQVVRLLNYLESRKGDGRTDINQSLNYYAMQTRRVGLAIVITDLFSPGGYLPGLNRLLGQGYDTILLHLLAPEDISPPYAGDLRLVDIETGQAQEVSLDQGLRQAYRQAFDRWQAEILSECRRRGVRYLQISTDQPWDKVVLYEMRKASLVK